LNTHSRVRDLSCIWIHALEYETASYAHKRMALPTKTHLTCSRTCNAKTPKHTSFVFSVPKNVLFPALETL